MIIDTGIQNLRDPFILVDDGVYYAYGTGVSGDDHMDDTKWTCYKNTDGKMYLSVHSPNLPTDECDERTILVQIKEENGTLVCEI